MRRKSRSDQDLQRFSDEHLLYEIQMLNETTRFLAGPGRSAQWVNRMAAIESFVIHVRNLMDFLYSDKPKRDWAIAEDFLSDPSTWQSQRPPKSNLMEVSHRRAHKEVAHLTYLRIAGTPKEKEWPFLFIAGEVNRVFLRFLDFADPSRVGVNLRAFVFQLRGVHPLMGHHLRISTAANH